VPGLATVEVIGTTKRRRQPPPPMKVDGHGRREEVDTARFGSAPLPHSMAEIERCAAMSETATEYGILTAVDGSAEARAAVAWATREATLRNELERRVPNPAAHSPRRG
jgi:hypothetical protein